MPKQGLYLFMAKVMATTRDNRLRLGQKAMLSSTHFTIVDIICLILYCHGNTVKV